MAWTVGTLFEAGFAWAILPALGWRALIFCTSIPLALLLLFLFTLPESPRYLLVHGRKLEAFSILFSIANTNMRAQETSNRWTMWVQSCCLWRCMAALASCARRCCNYACCFCRGLRCGCCRSSSRPSSTNSASSLASSLSSSSLPSTSLPLHFSVTTPSQAEHAVGMSASLPPLGPSRGRRSLHILQSRIQHMSPLLAQCPEAPKLDSDMDEEAFAQSIEVIYPPSSAGIQEGVNDLYFIPATHLNGAAAAAPLPSPASSTAPYTVVLSPSVPHVPLRLPALASSVPSPPDNHGQQHTHYTHLTELQQEEKQQQAHDEQSHALLTELASRIAMEKQHHVGSRPFSSSFATAASSSSLSAAASPSASPAPVAHTVHRRLVPPSSSTAVHAVHTPAPSTSPALDGNGSSSTAAVTTTNSLPAITIPTSPVPIPNSPPSPSSPLIKPPSTSSSSPPPTANSTMYEISLATLPCPSVETSSAASSTDKSFPEDGEEELDTRTRTRARGTESSHSHGSSGGGGVMTLRDVLRELWTPHFRRTTVLLSFIWFTNAFGYYGLVVLTTELTIDPSNGETCTLYGQSVFSAADYIGIFVAACAEFPGLLFALCIVDFIGRKRSSALLFVLAGVFISMLGAVPHSEKTITTIFLFFARAFMLGAFTLTYLYTPEVFPTSFRTTAFGLANAQARVGGMISPFVGQTLVAHGYVWVSLLIFSIFCVVSGVCSLMLPMETKGVSLQESSGPDPPKQPCQLQQPPQWS